MPIYEYKCQNCAARVEKMQKVSDPLLAVCEVCGGKLEKQWSLSGFQFKGAGWYVSDYSNKLKDPNAAKTEKSDGSATAAAEKSESAKKTSAAESTAKGESASNTKNETSATPTETANAAKKETTATKD